MKTLLGFLLLWLPWGGTLAETPVRDLDLVVEASWPGFARGPAQAVTVSGNYAYIAYTYQGDWSAGLQVIDISNKADPRRVGGHKTTGEARGVAVTGNYAYVTGDGFRVIDISNPANPQQVGADTRSAYGQAVVSGNYAYVLRNDGLQVIDISSPGNLQSVGGYKTAGSPSGVAVSGDYAFVAGMPAWDGIRYVGGGMDVIDISSPANPRLVGQYPGTGRALAIAVSGNYAFLAAGEGSQLPRSGVGLQVIDISNPADPQRVGGYDTYSDISSGLRTSTCCWSPEGVRVSANYAYLTGGGGIQVINISNPASPQRVGGILTGRTAEDVTVLGNYAYVAAGSAGLQVIDISNPDIAQRVGGHDPWDTQSVAVSGSFAYLAESWRSDQDDRRGQLAVIDISNPASLHQVAAYGTSGYANDLAVSGDYAYVADGTAGLLVLNISNPAVVHCVGAHGTRGEARGLALSGNYAYVTGGAGVEVFDISHPAKPRRVGGNSAIFDGARSLAVSRGRAFVTAGADSLIMLQMQPFFRSVSKEAQNISLVWEGFGPVRLQRTTSFGLPDWQDLQGDDGANAAILPISSSPEFFRLVIP